MKILISSHHFAPSTGGIETVTELLAREFMRRGHDVRIITQTPGNAATPFEVIRQPSATALVSAVRWCDVYVQNNISMRTLWPLAIVRRPLFIVHQTWITAPDGSTTLVHALKRFVLRFGESIAISRPIAESLPVTACIIPNPYDETLFRERHDSVRSKDVIFVGRLVSDKGVDLLLDAVARLHTEQLKPTVTIVGDGPERNRLERDAQQLGIAGHVVFVGMRCSDEIAALLNEHKLLVVPSRWAEPFGIVALEGIACGCVVIGSASGGLPEAIGDCGMTFPAGDADRLAKLIAQLCRDEGARERLRAGAGAHLAQFTSSRIAELYLDAFAAALR